MKKLIVFLFITLSSLAFGQTVLNSHPLELKKAKNFHQIINTYNTKNNAVFVFATDKEKTTILKYNSAIFFQDSLITARPSENYKNISGYSFEEDENPTLYWASADLKKIVGVHYNLISKTTTSIFYELPLEDELVINVFNENNSFYILTQKQHAEKLMLYVFKNGKSEVHLLDFGAFDFYYKNKEVLTLNVILEVYPLEKIETRSYNPLFKSTHKSKFYVREKNIIFTFDHNFKETQLYEVDLESYVLKERKIPQAPLKRLNGTSNSYYHENKLYQLTLNDDELVLGIRNYESSEMLKSFAVSKNDTISFKTSPLYSQVEDQSPQKIKSTSKFLSRLSILNVGLTIYKTPTYLFMTLGGNRSGGQFFIDPSIVNSDLINFIGDPLSANMNVYFENAFDKNLNNLQIKTEPLAVDFISNFDYEHTEASLQSSFKFKNFTIHGYYNTKTKQYIMMKFNDGFEPSF